MIIVGLDLSLTSTGIATIETGDGREHWTVERITSKARAEATLEERHTRLHNLRLEIALKAAMADLIVVEGPSYGSKTGHQHDRSGLWWLVIDWLKRPEDFDGWGKPVAEVPPSTRMRYATGKGQAAKDAVLAAVVRRYPQIDVTGNDEADALILACMGARHLGHPIDDLPKTHLAAMDAVRWPDVLAITAEN